MFLKIFTEKVQRYNGFERSGRPSTDFYNGSEGSEGGGTKAPLTDSAPDQAGAINTSSVLDDARANLAAQQALWRTQQQKDGERNGVAAAEGAESA